MLNFPDSPTNGQTFTGPNGTVWIWDGAKWVVSTPSGGGGGGGAAIAVGDTPPGNPVTGTLWFDSAGAQMYLRENDGTSVQWVPVVNQAGSLTLAAATNVGRNLLHNPLFNIAQRGAGPFAVLGSYTADRWYLSGATDTASIQLLPLSDADRTQIGDEAAITTLRNVFTGNAAAGASNVIYQGIESVRRLSGKTVTLSFWAQATASLKLGINYMQAFGSGGSPSTAVWANTTGQSVTIAGTPWARYSVTTVIPSTAGKTLGTNGADCTYLFLAFSSGATNNATYGNVGVQSGTIWLWGVQLEIGSQATPLEKPDPQQDLAKCQRFFCQDFFQHYGYGTAAQNIGQLVPFPVAMRGQPNVVIVSPAYANCSAAVTGNTNQFHTTFMATATALGATSFNLTWNASADL